MRPHDHILSQNLAATLVSFDQEKRHLPGIQTPTAFGTFVEQLLESIHRVKYVSVLRTRKISERCANPGDELFDPVKAAILYHRDGNIDEAFWLVFLLTHFGKHPRAGWHYVREIYGCHNGKAPWNWNNTSNNPTGFRTWLRSHQDAIKPQDIPHGFSNHRKYESLNADSSRGTGAAVASYIDWVGPTHRHEDLIKNVNQQSNGNQKEAFNYLFDSMQAVVSFGRVARFDYLTMVGHMGLINIEPGFAYLKDSTGPKQGARLLFGGDKTAQIQVGTLETWLADLDMSLGVGMQVLEDALCNWQKSPERFKRFRG